MKEHPIGPYLREAFPGLEITVSIRGKALLVESLVVKEGTGSKTLLSLGAKAGAIIVHFADHVGMDIILNATAEEGHNIDSKRLMAAYKRRGFVHRKKIKRVNGDCLMVRRSKTKRQLERKVK